MKRSRVKFFLLGMSNVLGILSLLLLCWTGVYYLTEWLHWQMGGLPMQLVNSLMGFILFMVLIMSIFSTLMRKKQFDFYQSIQDALKLISKGDFTVSIDVPDGWGREEQMNPLIQSINEMTADLGRLEGMRQEFISNVSHEIQSPLTSIGGFARVLKEKDLSHEQRDHYLDIIEQESIRLSRLSDNMLRLSSLESDQHPFYPTEFRLDKQLKDLILASEPQWMDKEIEMSADLESLSVEADSDLLSQVWVNLIHNAIKFTPESGTIWVSLKKEGEEAIIAVEDSGIGMSEESLGQIFDRFYKADKSRTRTGGGSGLGLSISQKIIEIHQGKIEVRSQQGIGTVMTVRVPLRQT